MEQAVREAAVQESRVAVPREAALTVEVQVEVAVDQSPVALEPQVLLVAAALAECWAESGFSLPSDAAGQAADTACSVLMRGCRLS